MLRVEEMWISFLDDIGNRRKCFSTTSASHHRGEIIGKENEGTLLLCRVTWLGIALKARSDPCGCGNGMHTSTKSVDLERIRASSMVGCYACSMREEDGEDVQTKGKSDRLRQWSLPIGQARLHPSTDYSAVLFYA